MLSGEYHTIPTDSITVADDRQRKKVDDSHIESLAESIRRRGLIPPIVVTRDHLLIAGECRLRAHQLLGYDYISVQYVDELPDEELELIELEENVKRKNLTWQEEVRAITRYHNAQKELNESWSAKRTGEELGMSSTVIFDCLTIERNFEVPEVAEATTYSAAKNFAYRREERAKTNAMRDLSEDIAAAIPAPKAAAEFSASSPKPPERASILNVSALEWFESPTLTDINFLHCDLPYGIGTGDKVGQSGAKNMGGYDDGEAIYWELLDHMLSRQDRFLSESCHLMFWFSMRHYENTVARLTNAGWRVFLPLLIWVKSDNAGILADKDRVPRNITEVAILASRGDRKIVRATSNAYLGATTKRFHMSEKPHAMLSHFFRMFVDESTVMLDPTCGSGMAVRVANEMGAKQSLGLELNEDYAADARYNIRGEE